ncbi:MAG: dihydrodipicolinate synthase family protein [Candidatus Altiarchaeota archaeon]|nr:dihydrodipicolinate synthase family protein [Candidatus Altiarchaeota archaeon]
MYLPGPLNIAIKSCMNLMGLAAGNPRLPLVPVSEDSRERISKVLQDMELI